MKTPITYYGGKQKLIPAILPIISKHEMYVEPFVGGGAVFFSKPQSHIEVINDTNKELINFYRVLQNKFVELDSMVKVTLHSRRLHKDASIVYEHPHLFDEVKRAWAVWVLSTQSFCAQLDGSWGYDKKKNTTTKKISNLSSYPSPLLQRYIKAHGWYYKCYESGVSVNSKSGYIKRKWEMLTANYSLE